METRRFVVNGETYSVQVQEIARGSVSFTLNGRTYKVSHEVAVPGREQAPATNGVVRRPVSGRASGNSVVAPISGVVVAIECEAGQAVTAGDIVIRLEAMKMQNGIPAPRDGKVAALSVKPGDEVREGDELLRFEEKK